MNLHGIVRPAITTVNPDTAVPWLKSTGYTTNAAGDRIPSYAAPVTIQAQIQAATSDDLEHVAGISQQGDYRAVYCYGKIAGIDRPDQTGGDVLQFPEIPGGTVRDWLVVKGDEQWPDWCRVIVRLQTSPPIPGQP